MSVSGFRPFSRQANLCLTGLACIGWLAFCPATFGQTIPTSRSNSRYFAKDALFEIPPAMEYGETFQGPIDLPLVVKNPDIAWDPVYAPVSDTLAEMGRDVVFRGDVYCLDFAFKSVRMVEVQGQTVWYLLYRVRYLGGDLRPKVEEDKYNNQVFATPAVLPAGTLDELPARFTPLFRVHVRSLRKEYLDQVIPGAKELIAAKERVAGRLYDSIEVQQIPIKLWRDTDPVDNSVWGVATWTNIDPRTDFFSVHIAGLTNAQRLKLDGEKIRYLQKNLVLNFSRPGDTVNESTDRIRYGVPMLEDELPSVASAIANEVKVIGGKTRNVKATYAAVGVLGGVLNQLEASQALSNLQPPSVDEFASVEEQQRALAANRLNNDALLSQVKAHIEKSFASSTGTGGPAFWSGAINTILTRENPQSRGELLDLLREIQYGFGASIPRQTYVLLQFGLEERLDHLWVYR